MAENVKCDWCQNYGASTWTKTIDKIKLTSKQKFCSLKCKTEFEDRWNIEWIEEKKVNPIKLIIVTMVSLYILSKC
jgi:hypothetical protein